MPSKSVQKAKSELLWASPIRNNQWAAMNGTRFWLMSKTLKYIEAVPKPNGKVYFYFRRRGKRTPLRGLYNSPKFLEAYWALRNGAGTQGRDRR